MSLLNLNYFEIFDIDEEITIDIKALNERYLVLQSKFHPDKFVNTSNIEKSMATRMSTHINDAYSTLKDLVSRVDYILEINNFSIDENKTFKNTSFLNEQMILSERISQANSDDFSIIKNEISIKIKNLISEMKSNLCNKDFDILHENNSMIKFYKKNIHELSN